MDARKQAILAHLANYRVSLRSVIEEHVIEGDASRELYELNRDNLIAVHERMLGGGRSVYQLSKAGAAEQGLPLSVAYIPGAQGFLANLSVLWFCFHGIVRRFRLEGNDQDELLGDETQGKKLKHLARYHVLEPGNPQSVVYRVYVPGSRSKIADVERKLYGLIALAKQRSKARALMEAGVYQIVVLVQKEKRAQTLSQFLHRPGRQEAEPVPSIVRVKIELVPDFLLPANSIQKSDPDV